MTEKINVEFTRDELSDIRYYLITFMQTFKSIDTSDIRKLVRKIEDYTQFTVDEQRSAGEELRKKLLNGDVVFDNPSEPMDSEDGLIDAFKKVTDAKK